MHNFRLNYELSLYWEIRMFARQIYMTIWFSMPALYMYYK